MSLNSYTWQFYLSPAEAWKAMYEDCQKAKRSIEVEQYILENDSLGEYFMALFAKKAAEGLRVFVLCDRFGSATLLNSEAVKNLQLKGGKFYFYNPWRIADIFMGRLFPRTHTKTMLIDSSIAYTGGVCFAERMREWRDTQIRVTGPVTEQVRAAFDYLQKPRWKRPWRRTQIPMVNNYPFLYRENIPLRSLYVIYLQFSHAIRHAKKYIYISTAFFAPNRHFRNLLKKASRRGVEVILLVPERSDVLLADWLFLTYADSLLAAGVRIFRYQRNVLHNKTIVIDDQWATVGSTNMDVFSFFRNRESNIIIQEQVAVAELKQHFMNDLQNSQELTIELLSSELLAQKWLGYIGRLIKVFF